MSTLGGDHPTYEPLRQAFEAHAKSVWGDDYVLVDFAMIGFVMSMESEESANGEYVMAASTNYPHIIAGLIQQTALFQGSDSDDD